MSELIIAFCVALAVTALATLLLLPALRHFNIGQSIREEGPKWHQKKTGTPIMGGLFFMIGIAAAAVILGWPHMRQGDHSHLFILLFAVVFGAIGFIDDFFKVKKKQNLGLTSLQKLLLQLAVSAAFIALLRYAGYLTTDIYIPFVNVTLHVNMLIYTTVSLLVIAGMVNAVNLTDGVDGLCSGVMLPIAVFFAVTGYLWQKGGLSVFAAALAGALVGFLIYNFHPAKIFMGETGSLFLGGALCGMGFVSGVPLLIIVVGAVYIWEMVTVMLQVICFKVTGGKRLFKMAPFHHHLEIIGWSEKRIFAVFMGLTAVFCGLAWIGVRYLLTQ